eukprot:gb/GECG01012194.1/.p1 GENE.gb/GECG01012194.1/~~gb/GECG01012194.1/.p1  ORF type:complete len:2141 (+),score=368.29 gb/GECG01012194.1/:1-6423(+)
MAASESSDADDGFPMEDRKENESSLSRLYGEELPHQDPLNAQAAAESKLIVSLRHPRKYFTSGKQQLTQTNYPKDADGNDISPRSWKKLRVPKDQDETKAQERDETYMVRSLKQAKRWDTAAKPLSDELQSMYQQRRHRHDQAVADWERQRKAFFAWAEEQVETESRQSRKRLNEITNELYHLLDTLQGNHELLLSLMENDLGGKFREVDDFHEKEDGEISRLEQFLDNLENQRADELGEKLRNLVSTVFEISYDLPVSFERYVEDESYNINCLILENRKRSAEAIARLRKEATLRRSEVQKRRDVITQQWRDIHHRNELEKFKSALLTEAYTSPSEQPGILAHIREEQQRAHWYYRIPFLVEVLELACTNRDEEEITTIAEKLKNSDSRVLKQCSSALSDLSHAHRGLLSRIGNEVEELRIELHRIGSLHPPIDMNQPCETLREYIEGGELTELFREAGELKPTLNRILKVCTCNDRFYMEHLTSVRNGLSLVCNSFALKEGLEKSGKETYLKNAGDLLRTMRTASRTKIPNLLKKMGKQVSRISGITELSEELRAAVEELSHSVQSLLEQIGESQDDTDTSRSGPEVTPRSEGSSEVKKEDTSTSGGSRAFASKLPMEEIRSAQRRFAMLLWSHELPEELKSALTVLQEKTTLQNTANQRVDDVMEREVQPFVNARDEESQEFIERVRYSIWEQTKALSRNSQSICTFAQNVVEGFNLYEKALRATVEFFDKSIFRARKCYMKELNSLEKEYDNWCKKIRQANSLAELQENADETKEMINRIQGKLRERHDTLHTVSGELPKRIGEAINGYKDLLTHQFEIYGSDPEGYTERGAPSEEELRRLVEREAVHEVINLLEKGPDEIEAMEIAAGSDIDEGDVDKMLVPGIEVDTVVVNEIEEGGTRIAKCRDRFNELGDTEKHKVRYYYLRKKLDKEGEMFDTVTVDEELREIGKLKVPEGLKRFSIDPVDSSLQSILFVTCKTSPYPPYGQLRGKDVPDNVIWTKRYHPRSVFSLLQLDEKFLGSLLSYSWYSKGRSLQEQAASRRREKEERASNRLEEFYKSREVPQEKDSKKSKKGAPKSKKKETADVGPSEELLTEERRQMEAEDQLSRSLIENDQHFERRLAPYSHGIENEYGIPLDCSGNPCVEDLRVEPSYVHARFIQFRSTLLTEFDKFGKEQDNLSERKTNSRLDAYTEELDEQTRLLQPRVGVIETQLRQPREYELLSHSKQLERHCMQFHAKHQTAYKKWDELRNEVPKLISNAKKQTRVHVKEVERETSVAKLQLVQEEQKKEVSRYWSGSGSLSRKAEKLINDESSKLTTLNNEFLRSCVSFSHGGDFGDEELEQVRAEIAKLNETVSSMKQELSSEKEKWNADMEEVQNDFENFVKSFEQKLRQLQLEQGLGQRFGKPRRQALEQIRSQYTKSERDAYNIQRRLQELRELSTYKAGDNPCKVEPGISAESEKFVVEVEFHDRSHAWEHKWDARPTYMPEISSLEDYNAVTKSAIQHEAAIECMAYLHDSGESMQTDLAKRILSNRKTDIGYLIFHAPLAVRMRCVIRWLCKAFIDRCRYLDYLKKDCRRFDPKRPPVRHDVSPKPVSGGGEDEDTSARPSSGKDKKKASKTKPAKGGTKRPQSGSSDKLAAAESSAFMSFLWKQEDFKRLTSLFDKAENFVDKAENEKNRQEQIEALGLTQEELEEVEAAEQSPTTEGEAEDMEEQVPHVSFLPAIEDALSKCKEDTKRLLESEGETYGGRAEDSMNEFSEEQLNKAETSLTQMRRQLSEQLQEFHQLLSDSIPLLVFDIMKRSTMAADTEIERLKKDINQRHQHFQNLRNDNASYLTPLLSDKNRKDDLDDLQRNEAQRQEDHVGSIAGGYVQILEGLLTHLLLFYKNLSFNLVAVAQDVLMCPLPQDLNEASKNMDDEKDGGTMSMRRLKKRLQRSELENDVNTVADESLKTKPLLTLEASQQLFEALSGMTVTEAASSSQLLTKSTKSITGLDVDGAKIETDAYRIKLWTTSAIPLEIISVPEVPEWVQKRVDMTSYPHLDFMLRGDQPQVFIHLVTFYNSIFRKLFGERDHVSQQYLAGFSHYVASMSTKIQRIHESLYSWQDKWGSMMETIRNGETVEDAEAEAAETPRQQL